jgi:hydrogenase maturation protein HypF
MSTSANSIHFRRRFIVSGAVQGVGFRPFVYRIALEKELTGFVRNTPDGVVIEVQGSQEIIASFAEDLEKKLPPLAEIVSLAVEDIEPQTDEGGFQILESSAGAGHSVLISPDTAVCVDCMADIFDEADPRHLYPFTNCTNCGPRYTITTSIPYDRAVTSMACFPMCGLCDEEYQDPLDRRFHAQPNACPTCGPQVWLTGKDGGTFEHDPQVFQKAAALFAEGKILAVKGLGGFHLVCDATNNTAVQTLRDRKRRPSKPLAVMVPDLETAHSFVEINEAEAELLSGRVRPIVLCRQLPGAKLAAGLSPDTKVLGIMLPYTPLHHVLLHHYKQITSTPALVMTSGNTSGEPICLGNREAVAKLKHIADGFLFHDRDILVRVDDSVVRVLPQPADGEDEAAQQAEAGRGATRLAAGDEAGSETEPRRLRRRRPAPAQACLSPSDSPTQFLRRARGYVPTPVFLQDDGPCVLGVGPELKNTVCLLKKDQAFVGQHIGDLENLETYEFFKEVVEHLGHILQVEPELVVHDLHPDFLSTKWAKNESDLPTLAVQHHVAHIHAVLAENRHLAPALGLALDGSGYGENATIWGGELLLVDNEKLEHSRLAHLAPVKLPGGDAAVREPWRIAAAFFHALGEEIPAELFPGKEGEVALLGQMLDKGINSPLSTSCGRLFDGVAALLGLKHVVDYEAQAAVIFEEIQDMSVQHGYDLPLQDDKGPRILDSLSLFAQIYDDMQKGVEKTVIARKFHLGLVQGLADALLQLSEESDVRTVALSGGVFLNRTLATLLPRKLAAAGLCVLEHRLLPPGDGCVSLGQAVYGRLHLVKNR